MNRKLIIGIVAAVIATLSAVVLTADEQSMVCQTLCSSGE